MKAIKRITALLTVLLIAIRSALSFLSWVEKQDEGDSVWSEDGEMEESF
jgi:preprotein translocase subunit SecG